jgi:hypothetical protein
MSDEKETVPVRIIFGFQMTHVSDVDGELVTTTYEPGQEIELEAGLAREEEYRNRVRIIRPEPIAAPTVPEAEVRAAAAEAAAQPVIEPVTESVTETPAAVEPAPEVSSEPPAAS